jgi:hypothetical protein
VDGTRVQGVGTTADDPSRRRRDRLPESRQRGAVRGRHALPVGRANFSFETQGEECATEPPRAPMVVPVDEAGRQRRGASEAAALTLAGAFVRPRAGCSAAGAGDRGRHLHGGRLGGRA